jgi:hypothetical protein
VRRASPIALVVALAACVASPRPSFVASQIDAREAPPPRSPAPAPPAPDSPAPAPPAPAPPAPDTPDLAAEAAFALPIPARDQAAESPSEGWCGETAIQEGLLYLGVWAPQRLIHRAGRPRHPDLYSPEIPIALAGLGVRHTFYPAKAPAFSAFAAWAKGALEEGDPVLAGVRILPTTHPEWDLDHFVLVVGHGAKGLLVNTTWGSRAWVADAEKGLSFKKAVYGIRLRGLRLAGKARPARLAVLREGAATVSLRVSCTGLESGRSYRMERRRHVSDAKPRWSKTLVAASGRVEEQVDVEADVPAQFQCVSP